MATGVTGYGLTCPSCGYVTVLIHAPSVGNGNVKTAGSGGVIKKRLGKKGMVINMSKETENKAKALSDEDVAQATGGDGEDTPYYVYAKCTVCGKVYRFKPSDLHYGFPYCDGQQLRRCDSEGN